MGNLGWKYHVGRNAVREGRWEWVWTSLVCVTSFEKDKFPTENFPEIKGSHREISGGKYTTERKETSSRAKVEMKARSREIERV